MLTNLQPVAVKRKPVRCPIFAYEVFECPSGIFPINTWHVIAFVEAAFVAVQL